jgi:Tfp pilus assembly protein PilE
MIRRRRGFTMVEILIVIGVIILLVGIGVIAYRGLDKMASSRATHVMLDNANAMVAEYEHGGQLSTMKAVYDPNVSPRVFFVATSSTDFIDARYSAGSNKWDVTVSGPARGACIEQCATVVERLIFQPRNKQALSGLPQKSLLDAPPTAASRTPGFADGWRNPIIFCPSGGIKVTLDPDGAKRDVLITSPDHRPFWASAGPDGDFSRGDDNEYSFAK